jgi:hypothetical protein
MMVSVSAPDMAADGRRFAAGISIIDQAKRDHSLDTVQHMKTRIMYIERKAGSLAGEARIGRVTFNKTGRTIYYREQVFRRITGGGFKSNYLGETSGEDYWISGPKRRGGDRMHGSTLPVAIDEDARVEYWCDIRDQPKRIDDDVA